MTRTQTEEKVGCRDLFLPSSKCNILYALTYMLHEDSFTHRFTDIIIIITIYVPYYNDIILYTYVTVCIIFCFHFMVT